MIGRLGLALGLALAASGCSKDACQSEPASFQLDLASGASIASAVRSLDVEVVVGSSGWRKTFDPKDGFNDGATSLAIVVEPAPSEAFDLRVSVIGKDAAGRPIASAQGAVRATPDGCNRIALSLADNADGGLDAAVTDAPGADVEPLDAPSTDAPITDAQDGGLDAEPDPDATPTDAPDDAGPDPDATVPDVNVVSFGYQPANFEPARLQPLTPLTIDCGTVVFDSTSATFDRDCGRSSPTPTVENQTNGPDVVVIPILSLDVAAGSTLRLVGDRPVVLAVFGDAHLDGTIDASSEGPTRGAGSASGLSCLGMSGDAAGTIFAGGGGGGALGSDGGDGGNGGITGIGANGGNGNVGDLTPLRGGCPGGAGGTNNGGAAGAGGGAFQISAAGALSVTNTALMLAGGGGGSGGPRRSGAGGGGSGGGILLEADDLQIDGTLFANGGGGGGGGPESNVADGTDGQNGGQVDPLGGQGGGGAQGGDGGDGANESRSNGTDGGDGSDGAGANTAGGGGGGGGLGVIQLRGDSNCTNNGTASPSPNGC